MSPTLDNEETDAIREIAQDVAESQPGLISLRDFHQPRRLSASRIRWISKKIAATFQEITARMRPMVRETVKLDLASVTEVNAADVFETLDSNFLLQCFRCEGELGWLIWNSGFAAAAAEATLTGNFEGEIEERKLSSAELCVVSEILNTVTEPIAKVFGFQLEPIQMVQDVADLTELSPSTDRVEPRLGVQMRLEGIGGMSELSLYISGFAPEEGEEVEANALPDHLNKVTVGLQAYLASIDVPLTDLLNLELGDVIPLGVQEGAPIQLYTEDRLCATAHMGRIGKSLAVRVEALDPRSGDIEQLNDD